MSKDAYPMLNRYNIPDAPHAEELVPYLKQIDTNRWYSNFGPLVNEFERRMQAHLTGLDSRRDAGPLTLTTLISCYHALQIGLQVMRLPPSARVLVPAVTFPACPLAVRHAGAEPILADVDAKDWTLTAAAARRIAQRMPVHAVMPVAVYGVPVPADEWDSFTADTGIPVIIDAAAAVEAQEIPCRCLVAHSLHATKPFSVGEGGLLISRRRELIEEARTISNFGTRERLAIEDGSNAKMSEYHAAAALAQLNRWEGVKQRRKDVYGRYRRAVEQAGLDLSFQPRINEAIVSSLMLKTAQAPAAALAAGLTEHGVLAHRTYLPPLYRHPHFGGLAVVDGDGHSLPGTAAADQKTGLMKNSEMMMQSVFGVPFHAFLTERDIEYVVAMLGSQLRGARVRWA